MNTIFNITRKELLKEVAGISFIVREWAKILKKEVEQQNQAHKKSELEKISKEPEKKEETKSEKDDPFYWEDDYSRGTGSMGYPKWYSESKKKKDYYKKRYQSDTEYYSYGYGGYGSYKPTKYVAPLEEIVVMGEKYPEQYKDFSVDKWVFKNSTRIEYDHWKSGYDDEGKYVVYFNVPIASLSEGAFIHEIKHAYDDWNRMSHGGKPIRDTWEIKNIYTPDFEKLVLGGSGKYPQLGPLIRYFYLGSKLETPAYLENEYDNIANYEDVARKMKEFDTQKFFNKEGKPAKGLEEEFEQMKKLDIPVLKKYKNVTDFLAWVKKYFNQRGEDIFRRIAKMKYVHGKPMSPFKPVAKQKEFVSTTGKQKPATQYTLDFPSDIKKYEEETGESAPWFEFEEGETLGDWKYSKDRGWYYVGEDDGEYGKYYY